MKIRILFIVGLFIYGLNYGQKAAQVKTQVDSIFNAQLQQDLVHNAFLTVYSDKLEIDWNYSNGAFKYGEKVTKNNPFHSTSVAKTFTAVLIMQLQEDGKLDLDDPIAEYLAGDIIKALHVYNGKDYSKQILIKDLLQHTSGLPDYFMDTPETGSPFMEQLFTHPDRFWQPRELIDFSKSQLQAHFIPGTGYNYCDTEYVLLGILIEELTGKQYHEVISEKIFNPLKMEHSYMPLRSKPANTTTGKLSEFYVDDTDISLFKSFKSMQSWTDESYGLEYGYGLRKFQLRKLYQYLPNLTLIGHSGTSGSFMYYCPELDVYLTGTFNQTAYQKKHVDFMVSVLSQLKNLSKVKSKRNGKR